MTIFIVGCTQIETVPMMTIKNLLLFFAAVSFGVVYSAPATASVADAITEIATQSRHLADAGKWDDARTVLELNSAGQAKRSGLDLVLRSGQPPEKY
jgi:hypothetical protein